MSDFKKKLLHDVVNPAKESGRIAYMSGEVTESKNDSKCKVTFTDKSGNTHTNETVDIQMSGDVAWCPKEGDQVIIQQNERDNFIIVGKYMEDFSEYQTETTLKADTYSNYISDSMPGSIY